MPRQELPVVELHQWRNEPLAALLMALENFGPSASRTCFSASFVAICHPARRYRDGRTRPGDVPRTPLGAQVAPVHRWSPAVGAPVFPRTKTGLTNPEKVPRTERG